ncbi:MAG TPA: hypothetical protein PLL10_09905, partial [Elusimicrobiales bacterium]|nr:hypothetical protein [Elusimicrobiales bacterium]
MNEQNDGQPPNGRLAKILLYGGFFCTGLAALIYENLWARHLALLLGGTAAAHTAVLCAFMGGLAAGGPLLGRLADKSPDKARFYAFLNFFIGLWAAASPTLFGLAPENPGMRWFYGLFIAGIPCVLMGGTLPALASLLSAQGGRGEVSARLYYANSAGAVAGCLLGGLWLIARLGIDFPLSIGAALNIGAALAALWAGQNLGTGQTEAAEHSGPPADSKKPETAVLGAVFISGFAALACELGWIRLFTLVLGSSTYSFALMLAAFI